MKQKENLEKKLVIYLSFTSHEPKKEYVCTYPDHFHYITKNRAKEYCFNRTKNGCCPYLEKNLEIKCKK